MPGTWIVVLHYSGVEDTRACLRSLHRQSTGPLPIVLVDNRSKDESSPFDGIEFENVPVLRPGKNLGWAGGNNVGIRYALEHGADRVVLMNNDAVADPKLIERLDSCGEHHQAFGILGAIVRDLDPPHAVQSDGFVFNNSGRPGFLVIEEPRWKNGAN